MSFVSFHKMKKRFTLTIVLQTYLCLYLPWWLRGEESACNVGDLGSIPGLGRPCEVGNGYPLQYSCLENSWDRGAQWTILHGVSKSGAWTYNHMYTILIYLNIIRNVKLCFIFLYFLPFIYY